MTTSRFWSRRHENHAAHRTGSTVHQDLACPTPPGVLGGNVTVPTRLFEVRMGLATRVLLKKVACRADTAEQTRTNRQKWLRINAPRKGVRARVGAPSDLLFA